MLHEQVLALRKAMYNMRKSRDLHVVAKESGVKTRRESGPQLDEMQARAEQAQAQLEQPPVAPPKATRH
eukprot:COSAG05_NODE_3613_length_1959_cov_7.422581_1_plen_69_part_00